MKSTAYIVEITAQKNEKYLSEVRNTLACLHARVVSTKKFSGWVYWKVFLSNQAAQFISRGISHSYISGNFLLSFLLWYDFKILVKSRRGGIFLCLALSVNVRQEFFFFIWMLNILSFIFLIWTEQFWIWFSQKLTKNVKKNFFFNFSSFYPLYDFRILVQIYQLII